MFKLKLPDFFKNLIKVICSFFFQFSMNANAASVSVLLTQGLHTKDMSLMEGVISKSFQKSVLQNTLRRMTSNDVVELLELV